MYEFYKVFKKIRRQKTPENKLVFWILNKNLWKIESERCETYYYAVEMFTQDF